MSQGTDILWIAAAALAVSSASLTGFGLRQRRYRGWLWWVAAMWLTTLGVATAAGTGGLRVVAELLLLQWPIVTLIGLRRFHARTALPFDPHLDWTVFVVAGLATASAPLWPPESTVGALLPATAAVLVHLYAAGLFFCGPGGRQGLPLQLLALTMVLVALVPLPSAWPGYDALASIEMRAVAAALGSVVMGFVALTLVCERNERQLRDSHRRLRALANMDALTNVPNRRHFHELALQALRSDGPGSATLVMFDVDHFKHINDGLGHAAGDRALRLVSGSVQAHLRAHDVAGRHGGDEFVLLLRNTPVGGAVGVASRIVDRLQSEAAAAGLPQLSLSFGMVQLLPGEGIDEALRRADQALYQAKRQGRSCAVTAGGDEDRPVFGESQRLGLTAC